MKRVKNFKLFENFEYEKYHDGIYKNKLYESPNTVTINGRYITSMCESPLEMIFLYSKDKNPKFYYEIGCECHDNLANKNGVRYNRDKQISGRVFIKNKIITFWVYPSTYEQLLKIIDDINGGLEKIGFKVDETWKVEIPINRNKISNDITYINEYELVPIHEYKGGAKTSEEEMKIPHLINWKEKQELKKKGWGKGFGSDMTAWNSKNPLYWRQAKYQENIKNFDTFILNEGRKEDILQKFQDEYGKGLGLSLWESDPTENKAYIEWLLSFIKRNEKELGIDKLRLYKGDKNDIGKFIKERNKVQSLLTSIIKKYDNNKKDFSKPINQIKTIEDLKKILDEKDKFEKVANINDEKFCKVWFNNLEWIVFQPFKYEIAQFAYKKDRKRNWCTTCQKSQFDNHNGEKGGIIYCINKLDSTKDVAFELFPNEIVKKWDYEDNDTKIDIFQMKNEFEEGSEIYEIFDNEIEHEIELPTFSRNELEEKAREYFSNMGIEELGLNADSIFDYLDINNFTESWIEGEAEYFADSLIDMMKSYADWDSIYKYITRRYSMDTLLDFFGCDNEDEFKEKFYKGEGQYYDHDDIERLVVKYNDEYNFAKYFMNKIYKGYLSRDIYEEFFGNADKANIKEILNFARNHFDEDNWIDYKIQSIINDMTDEDILEMVFDI